MKRIVELGWLVIGLIVAWPAVAAAAPKIKDVRFSRIGPNLHLEVEGSGFGTAPQILPATTNLGRFSFRELSKGNWCAGGTNCPVHLQFTSWTESRIVVDGFGTQYGSTYNVAENDKVEIAVNDGTAAGGATWNGKLEKGSAPALKPGGPTPQIADVTFSRIGQNLHIEVKGAGFGLAPQVFPAVTNVAQFWFGATSRGNWCAGGTNCPVHLQYTAWSDTRIVADGFGTQYGGGYVVQPGDDVSLFIQHVGGPEFTVWSGKLNAERPPALDPGGPVPQIGSVEFGQIGKNLRIEVLGAGFGSAPSTLPQATNLAYFGFTEASQGNWCAGSTNCPVLLQYTSWADNKIVIEGFGTQYGTTYKVAQGDKVTLYVRNSRGPLFSVWNGQLTKGKHLAAPQLLAPAAGASVKKSAATFSWTPVPNASAYYVQIYLAQVARGEKPSDTATTLSTQVPGPEYQLDVGRLAKGTYRWRVSAVNKSNELILPGWSEEAVFEIP